VPESAAAKGASPAAPPPPSPTEPEPPSHADWPQFLGPARSGVIDASLDTDWEKNPPRLLWRQSVGTGWAGFAVSSGIAVTQEQRGDEERVIAYDLRTGRPLWSHADRTRHDSPLGSEGPRAVPAIDAGQVMALGATGILNALDLRSGRLLWSRNILADNGSAEPGWGVSVSPLVRGSRVIVSAGGAPERALVAYDRNTGEPSWAAGSGGLSYSSPALMTLAGREQIVMLNKSTVAGHDAETGAVLWQQDFPHEQPNVAQPIALSATRVLFSAGYGIGSRVFEISQSGDAQSARQVWATPRLKSKFANMVAYQGSVYGLDDGVFVCIDPETGERRWKAGRYGHGQLILARDKLLVQTEEGEIVMIDPNPERLIEVARFSALSGKTWNPPALAAPILLVRNDLEAAAWELPVRR
jgi:outer membrane protein assembly factor BamB